MDAAGRARVICVDDEPHVVSGLALHLRRRYDVEIATSAQAGLELLARSPEAAVVISDMRMPNMNGAEFLARVSLNHPNTTRILLTGHAELDAAIRAINEGSIFRFLIKPCPPPELLRTVEAATEHHRLKVVEKLLLEKTLHGSIKMLSEVLSITNPLAFGRATRVKTIVSQLADKLGQAERWQVEVAAMLSQLASITLPNETAEKVYYGTPLTRAEQQMVERAPDVTDQLLKHIPRLEAVREILSRYPHASSKERAAGLGPDQQLVRRGAELLSVAVEYDALEAKGQTSSEAMVSLGLYPEKYESEVLMALQEVCHSRPQVDVVREVSMAALKPGMVFACDVKLITGPLFVARGYEVTAGFLERLNNLRPGSLQEPFKVVIRGEEPPTTS